ncbi:MAG: hypothetical protein Kow00108_24850 [Calditrichia bacterium]
MDWLPAKSSTKAFIKEAKKIKDYSLKDWIHGYIYIKFPYLYIGVGKGEHKFSAFFDKLWKMFNKIPIGNNHNHSGKDFAEGYHGKVVPLEQATQLVKVDREIKIDDLEAIIPYSRARSLIMKNPDHIAVLECPCRASKENPCLPMDVCLIIGEPFVSFVLEHHPQKSRKISSDEAVQILTEEDKRGHVHHAFFKDAMLQRFYAICNCCSCCCGAMKAMQNGVPMLAPSGYVLEIEHAECVGCGECIQYCQFNALELKDKKAHVIFEKCYGCGVCVDKCPHHAHQLVRSADKGEPLEIKELMKKALN